MSRHDDEPGFLHQPRLAPGFLVCLPLFLCYEIGLLLGGESMVPNGAESLLTIVLAPLGPLRPWLRMLALAVLTLVALGRARDDEEFELGPSLLRTVLEGGLLALVLGPVLLWMLSFFSVPELDGALGVQGRSDAPQLAYALRLIGAAPWEELLFRVAIYGVVYLFARRIAEFLGGSRAVAWIVADVAAILVSSIAFAAFHLEWIQELLGRPGEAFHGGVFLWRLLAGLCLAGIFRVRGLGVSAWTHGVFNLGLALGAGPGVFLGA